MKKLFVILTMLVMAVTMAGCGEAEEITKREREIYPIKVTVQRDGYTVFGEFCPGITTITYGDGENEVKVLTHDEYCMEKGVWDVVYRPSKRQIVELHACDGDLMWYADRLAPVELREG